MNYQDSELEQNDNDEQASQTRIPSTPIEQAKFSTESLARTERTLMWLIASHPSDVRGTVLPVTSGAIIGRRGDILWRDAHMSRKHALFSLMNDPENPDDQLFTITPYKDRNGTLVNGKRISKRTVLRENDVILMGDTQFVVKMLV